jgi:hypothetical protein
MSDATPSWYVTTKATNPVVRHSTNVCKVYAYLRHTSCPDRVFQELSGPTAEDALRRFAEHYNRIGKVPPDEAKKCAADEGGMLL